MNARTSILFLCGAVAVGALVRCGGDSTPTQPATPVPTVPATTTTTAPAGIVLPPGMVCDPTPPPLKRVLPQLWRQRGDGWIIDSKPQVVNTDNYCQRTGQSGKDWCDTRVEGDPQREACDYLAVGVSSETGRWGPTWTVDGKKCDPPGTTGSSNPCANHPDNQFQVFGKGAGLYEACASPLAKVDPVQGERCGQVQWVPPY